MSIRKKRASNKPQRSVWNQTKDWWLLGIERVNNLWPLEEQGRGAGRFQI